MPGNKTKQQTCPKLSKINQESYLVTRLDLNSFLTCLMVLQCLIIVSNEFHKVGPVTCKDGSESIFWFYEYCNLLHFFCRIFMNLVK